jgi:hypothetical protein
MRITPAQISSNDVLPPRYFQTNDRNRSIHRKEIFPRYYIQDGVSDSKVGSTYTSIFVLGCAAETGVGGGGR